MHGRTHTGAYGPSSFVRSMNDFRTRNSEFCQDFSNEKGRQITNGSGRFVSNRPCSDRYQFLSKHTMHDRRHIKMRKDNFSPASFARARSWHLVESGIYLQLTHG
ncbi:unnamed protein product, partial [Mesorhabditis spiculigera]